MLEAYLKLVKAARDWWDRAVAAGWLGESDQRRFAALEQATPADLFVEAQMRPLVVALFGGTGVGKSSLLNRLAGAPIARVGVERPTSRDVTLYVHESVRLADLPPELPVDRVQVRRHNSPAHQEILWVDAPDIDSTEEANRRCALAWLPHVDLLCYVVSPERYRDDAGWRVLQERGHKHGWMFVMNRWDESDPQQRADFLRMLRGAGFDDPLLLCTCCNGRPSVTPDEFEQIQALLGELLNAHAVRELTRVGQQARVQELRGVLELSAERCGDGTAWSRLEAVLGERWEAARDQLWEGAGWELQTVASRFAVREGGVIRKLGERLGELRGGARETATKADGILDAGELASLAAPLWDDWSQAKIVACLDAIEIAARRDGMATEPLRQQLDAVAHRARGIVMQPVQDQVRAALARPGGLIARIGRRITGFLIAALPVTALAAVAYEVVVGYYRAATGARPFFGTEFAVHSVMLVVVAWALPFVVDRLLRPSLELTVLRALRAGFSGGLDALAAELLAALAAVGGEADAYRDELRKLLADAAAVTAAPVAAQDPALARLLAQRDPVVTAER